MDSVNFRHYYEKVCGQTLCLKISPISLKFVRFSKKELKLKQLTSGGFKDQPSWKVGGL